jgi:hypothetical protein
MKISDRNQSRGAPAHPVALYTFLIAIASPSLACWCLITVGIIRAVKVNCVADTTSLYSHAYAGSTAARK